jgi:hypothetical protein
MRVSIVLTEKDGLGVVEKALDAIAELKLRRCRTRPSCTS